MRQTRKNAIAPSYEGNPSFEQLEEILGGTKKRRMERRRSTRMVGRPAKKKETRRRIHSGRDSPPVSMKQQVPEDLEFRARGC